VALVGANGAGKSTLVKTISGLLRPHEGEILLDGRRIDRLSPRARVLGGIAHVPEGRQVSLVSPSPIICGWRLQPPRGAFRQWPGGAPAGGVPEPAGTAAAARRARRQSLGRTAADVGNRPRPDVEAAHPAPGRAILGLSPVLVTEIFRLIERLKDQGLSILLSEQNARLSLAIADRGCVIEKGRLTSRVPGASFSTIPRWQSAISASARLSAGSASSASGRWLRA